MTRMTVNEAMQAAVQHHRAGRLPEAEAIYRQVLTAAPNHRDAIHNLGEIAFRVKKFDVALQYVDRAIALEPARADFHNTRSVILFAMGRADEAWTECTKALELKPDSSSATGNLGILYADRCDLPASIAAFRRAIELDPNNAPAHDGLGLSLLMSGQLQEGWREQEWRWKKYDFIPRRFASHRQWDGSSLAGRTIRLLVEQGFGDMFQFCRYVPLLADQGASVLLETVKDIYGLMSRLRGVKKLILTGDEAPPMDFVCPLMSVPLLYGTDLGTIPADVPYLTADEKLVAQWKQSLSADQNLKVGIAWAGRPTHPNDHNRSIPIAEFAPLLRQGGVTFYSLQKGNPDDPTRRLPRGNGVIDLADRLTDFDQTAAAIAALDLLISVDTSLVHLAGAMARPVWTLLPFSPDWRWMLHREDSPWYPTMRLFRASRRRDWAPVIEQAAEALKAMKRRPQ